MKKAAFPVAIATLFVLLLVTAVVAAGCSSHSKSPAAVAATKTVSAVCPVMGNRIPDVTKAAGKSVYKGKTYYFCCPGCKPQFDKDPEKYINKKK